MPFDASIFSRSDVLITGGLGFIGSSLARRLVTLGAKVMLVDSLIPESPARFIPDAMDIEEVAAIITGRPCKCTRIPGTSITISARIL